MVLRYAHVNVAHLAPSIDALPWKKSGDPILINAKNKEKMAG